MKINTSKESGNLKHTTRRSFLTHASGFITTAALSSACSTIQTGRLAGCHTKDPIQNAISMGFADQPIIQILNAGITAANPHNTQAWKFKILNPTTALLYVDESRLLPVTDPTFRQIHIGQGCLLETARIAASLIFHEASIKLFPEGYSLSTGTGDIGRRPIAKIQLTPTGNKIHPLAEVLQRRHTVRSAYDGPQITPEEFSRIENLIRQASDKSFAGSTVLKFVTQRDLSPSRPSHRQELPNQESTNQDSSKKESKQGEMGKHIHEDEFTRYVDLCMQGFRKEVLTRRTAEESRIWFRIGKDEVYSKRDGINLRDNGLNPIQLWITETFFLTKDPKDYYDESGTKQFLESYEKNFRTAKGMVLFITKKNSTEDWVRAGIDYTRFQLACTKLGFVSRPMSQLLQEFDEMKDLRNELERISGVKAPSKIQMMAFLGRGETDYYSPRRPIQSMIVDS